MRESDQENEEDGGADVESLGSMREMCRLELRPSRISWSWILDHQTCEYRFRSDVELQRLRRVVGRIIAAKDCVGCVANTTSYDPSKSSTATTDGVPFSVRYAIGSASGSLYTDVVQFAGLKVPAQTFALCTNITTVLIAGLSGLLGLAFQPLASTRAVPFFESVVNSGALPTDMFSFALNTAGIAAMTLGGTNTSLYQGGINWIARSGQGAYWSIPLQGVMVGGKELGITATEAVIDTGT